MQHKYTDLVKTAGQSINWWAFNTLRQICAVCVCAGARYVGGMYYLRNITMTAAHFVYPELALDNFSDTDPDQDAESSHTNT